MPVTGEMEQLSNDLMRMGALCIAAVDKALGSIDTGNREVAAEVVEGDAQVNGLEQAIEERCMRILLRYKPVAEELRRVVTTLKMATDLEAIGDAAADIAALCDALPARIPPELSDIKRMAAAAREMMADSIRAFVGESMVLADYVIRRDEIVNGYYSSIKSEIASYIAYDLHRVDTGLDYLMVIKYIERLADNAVSIAEWVKFFKTGKHDNMGRV